MDRLVKPGTRSWTEQYPELGTGPVSYADSISPEFYELERKAIFERAWLNVGRVEELPRNGSYFTKEIPPAKASVIVRRSANIVPSRCAQGSGSFGAASSIARRPSCAAAADSS